MKKPTRRSPSSEATSSHHSKKEGSWSFNLASESLFSLGATENARRVAYRTATGELRFLPL